MRYIIAILVLSALAHFVFWGSPNSVVFDEVHFGKFISGYFTGEYFFDIHPPLGKLLISATGFLAGFVPGFGFKTIGDSFTDTIYMWLRLLPMLAGTVIPLIGYLLARELKISKISSFLIGLLLVFENSLLVQSRFILLDSFLLLFGFSSLLIYLISKRKKSLGLFTLSIALASLALSVKWTGGSFLAIIGIFELVQLIKNHARLKEYIYKSAIISALPLLIYFSIFWVHFYLLDKSGPGDAFMTPEFQKTLEGSPYAENSDVKPHNLIFKFVELNGEMYRANQGLKAEHSYSSKWYTWPSMEKPIYYWNDRVSDATEARIYLLGNPIIYWLSLLAIVYLLSLGLLRDKLFKESKETGIFILAGFLINLLPFIFIGRVMFLYHYFSALVFAIIAIGYLVDRIKKPKDKKRVVVSIVALAIISFLFFSPLSYGLPLTQEHYDLRIWLNSWR